jgi:protein-arginine kinase
MTLGESEDEIVDKLNQVIEQVMEHEENARQKMLEDKSRMIADQVGRAYGIMMHSYSMTSKEVLNLLSMHRLGVDLGFCPEEYRAPSMNSSSAPSRPTSRRLRAQAHHRGARRHCAPIDA